MCADKVAATLKVVGLPFTFSFPSVLPGACLCLGLRLARTSLAPRVLPRAQSYPGKLDAISGPKATYPTDPTSPSHSARMAPEEFKHPGVGRLTRQPAAPHRHGAEANFLRAACLLHCTSERPQTARRPGLKSEKAFIYVSLGGPEGRARGLLSPKSSERLVRHARARTPNDVRVREGDYFVGSRAPQTQGR